MYEKTLNYTNVAGLDELPTLINAVKGSNIGMIRTSDGEEAIVRLSDWLVNGIELYDHVEIETDPETGELVVVDYYVTFEGTDKLVTGYEEQYNDMVGL